jgi:hypothetical protein
MVKNKKMQIVFAKVKVDFIQIIILFEGRDDC